MTMSKYVSIKIFSDCINVMPKMVTNVLNSSWLCTGLNIK